MNSFFNNFIFNLHEKFAPLITTKNYTQDPFLLKKLSDYYVTRLIPNFFIESKFKWQYSPHILSSRVLFSGFVLTVLYDVYFKMGIKEVSNKESLKYNFNLYDKNFIKYERQLLRKLKQSEEKIFY